MINNNGYSEDSFSINVARVYFQFFVYYTKYNKNITLTENWRSIGIIKYSEKKLNKTNKAFSNHPS